ncbi:MAG: hypothetical protein II551_07025 [Paludibacteraceae bacterium]|nr:hypothetical protein [Paludibacteraceae bacterium]
MSIATVKQLLNGDIFRSEPLRKQYPLLLLIFVLVIIYIMAGYQAVDQQNEIHRLHQELKTAKFQYLSVYTEYADQTRQTAIVERLETKNSTLKINMRPLQRID